MGLSAGSPQWRDLHIGPGNARRAEGRLELRNATLTVIATRVKFTLGILSKVTGEHQGNTDGSPVGALVLERTSLNPPIRFLFVKKQKGSIRSIVDQRKIFRTKRVTLTVPVADKEFN